MESYKQNLLLIDDNPGDARLVKEILAEVGAPFQVDWAERLSKGLEWIEEHGTDVLLLDLSLPECQGLNTLLEIQAHVSDIPVVILTGLEDEGLALKAVQEGAQDYLVKGQLTGNLLLRALRYAVERHKLQSALRSLSRDHVTGLYNHHSFTLLAEHQMAVARRSRRGLWLYFLSLLGLRTIQARFPTLVRHRVLHKIGNILKTSFRVSDIIARMRWDEFAVLTIDAADNSAELIKRRLEKNLTTFQETGHSGLFWKLGMARFDPEKTNCLGELLSMADRAMFEQSAGREGLTREREHAAAGAARSPASAR